jgi:hypothetical protein
VLDPSNRFLTLVLAAGSAVLLIAIGVGERMGDRVLGEVTGKDLQSITAIVASPLPTQSSGPFGPDWKRSDTISAAADPHFPDPRIPPQPLPTVPPTPKPTPTPKPVPATPTPNPNIPIWRQQPLPTATPVPTPGPAESSAPPEHSAEAGSPPPVRPHRRASSSLI